MGSMHTVAIDGVTAFEGDEQSTGVIFDNLTGKNFVAPKKWQTFSSYDSYLASIEAMHGIVVTRGSLIQLVDGNGVTLKQHVAMDDAPGSYQANDGKTVFMGGAA